MEEEKLQRRAEDIRKIMMTSGEKRHILESVLQSENVQNAHNTSQYSSFVSFIKRNRWIRRTMQLVTYSFSIIDKSILLLKRLFRTIFSI